MSDNGSLQYLTGEADRWDQIAYLYYGSASNFAPITAANPGLAAYPVLPPGIIITIPILDQADLPATPDELPPWRT